VTIAPPTLTNADVIINVVELNHRHGVGILLNRIFPDRENKIVLRTLNIYGGDSPFGTIDCVLGSVGLSREIIRAKVEKMLAGHTVNRILCVPYHAEEILMALAVQDLTGAPICTYVMDDRNLLHYDISMELMQELLDRSMLRLGISADMCALYSLKYQVPMYFAPPVISADFLDLNIPILPDRTLELQRGAIVGNIWNPTWVKLLRNLTKTNQIELDWYGNTGAEWNIKDRETLKADGIIERGFLPTEAELGRVLRTYAYVIVTAGTLDTQNDRSAAAWLSLPSRIPFILASSNTPIIVLGHPQTAGAQFVEQFGIGAVADYTPESLRAAIDRVTQPEIQQQMRENAVKLAPQLVNQGTDEWIWQSLAAGKPIDDRFERLLPVQPNYLAALSTCLTIIHDQQVTIQHLCTQAASPIEYLKQESQKFPALRHIWWRAKRKYAHLKQAATNRASK
jgi:hypothetical protein